MGNGPSLSNLLKENENVLDDYDLIAVNFMGLSPEFMIYKPRIYILCDPAFWLSPKVPETTREKVRDFYHQMVERVSWNLQLYIPYMAKNVTEIHEILSRNASIQLFYYNKTKVDGFKWFQYMMLKRQWGMFRTENVLIAALILCIYSQYKVIYLAGAENDWIRHLWVDKDNIIKINNNYYHKGKEGVDSIPSYKLHEICMSLYFAFKGYTDIETYARSRGVKIYNTCEDSYIDAFEKTDKRIKI
jgi:hypothetical protein